MVVSDKVFSTRVYNCTWTPRGDHNVVDVATSLGSFRGQVPNASLDVDGPPATIQLDCFDEYELRAYFLLVWEVNGEAVMGVNIATFRV